MEEKTLLTDIYHVGNIVLITHARTLLEVSQGNEPGDLQWGSADPDTYQEWYLKEMQSDGLWENKRDGQGEKHRNTSAMTTVELTTDSHLTFYEDPHYPAEYE